MRDSVIFLSLAAAMLALPAGLAAILGIRLDDFGVYSWQTLVLAVWIAGVVFAVVGSRHGPRNEPAAIALGAVLGMVMSGLAAGTYSSVYAARGGEFSLEPFNTQREMAMALSFGAAVGGGVVGMLSAAIAVLFRQARGVER